SVLGKTLQLPSDDAIGLKAIVMLEQFDQLTSPTGDTIYYVVQGTGAIIEFYRGQLLRFRSPELADAFQLSFSGHALRCERINLAGGSDGVAVELGDTVGPIGLDVVAARTELVGIDV